MTAVVNYATLKTATMEWMLDRTDLEDFLDAFIANAETRFNFGAAGPFPSDPIRTHDMQTSDDLTLTDGSVALPSTVLEVVRATALSSPVRKLEYATPDWIEDIYPSTDASEGVFYTIDGANLVVRPPTTSDIRLQYYEMIPALSDSNTTNWLILKAPSIYLYATCVEACAFLGPTAAGRAQTFYSMMTGAIGGLQLSERRFAAGTQPSRRASGAVA